MKEKQSKMLASFFSKAPAPDPAQQPDAQVSSIYQEVGGFLAWQPPAGAVVVPLRQRDDSKANFVQSTLQNLSSPICFDNTL